MLTGGNSFGSSELCTGKKKEEEKRNLLAMMLNGTNLQLVHVREHGLVCFL